MRKYLYLITDHPNQDIIGQVEITDKPKMRVKKNKEVSVGLRNLESGEKQGKKSIIGLGYEDFDSKDDYENSVSEVVENKLEDIDDNFL